MSPEKENTERFSDIALSRKLAKLSLRGFGAWCMLVLDAPCSEMLAWTTDRWYRPFQYEVRSAKRLLKLVRLTLLELIRGENDKSLSRRAGEIACLADGLLVKDRKIRRAGRNIYELFTDLDYICSCATDWKESQALIDEYMEQSAKYVELIDARVQPDILVALFESQKRTDIPFAAPLSIEMQDRILSATNFFAPVQQH